MSCVLAVVLGVVHLLAHATCSNYVVPDAIIVDFSIKTVSSGKAVSLRCMLT